MPDSPEQEFIALIQRLRDEENAARRHRRIEYEEENLTLMDLFDEGLEGNEGLARLLKALKEKKSVRSATEGRKLVVAGKPDESLFFSIITPDSDDEIRSMSRKFEEADRDIVKRWIESLPVEAPETVNLPPNQTK